MVYFEIMKKEESKVIYWYYPENDRSSHGIIFLNLSTGDVFVSEIASTDIVRQVSMEEINSLRDSVNQMRKIEGLPLLTEEEWPSAKGLEICCMYGDRAIRRIKEAYESGTVLESGFAAWY